MSEAPIVLSSLIARNCNVCQHSVSNSSEETTLASQSQSQVQANPDSLSVPQSQTQEGAQPELRCSRPDGQTNQDQGKTQGKTHVLARALKFLACWDCGPVGATIGIVGFATATLLAYYGLKLAIWTATKDYIEHCQADLNIDLMSEACQNAVHQQLPPPPFYSFHNLSGPAVGKRNIGSGMLIEPIGSYLHNNSYIWTYAALIKIVLPSLRKISTRWKISTPQKNGPKSKMKMELDLAYERDDKTLNRNQILAQYLGRIDSKQSAASSRSTLQSSRSYLIDVVSLLIEIFESSSIAHDFAVGRTGWSNTVTVQGMNHTGQYFYDRRYLNNAKEDAAEVAFKYLASAKIDLGAHIVERTVLA
ncbi:hypothetical protein EG329_002940 [Mollisiaceae sp. DMI_Dod_QoI]|nr:hypothetical protein EG329_002940 [Helotiales sp. DMI_Dod_QoI]